MSGLPGDTWLRLIVWLLIGFVVYFAYGRHHSVLRKGVDDRANARLATTVPPTL
jgi:hypothetical protein